MNDVSQMILFVSLPVVDCFQFNGEFLFWCFGLMFGALLIPDLQVACQASVSRRMRDDIGVSCITDIFSSRFERAFFVSHVTHWITECPFFVPVSNATCEFDDSISARTIAVTLLFLKSTVMTFQ